MNYEKMFEYLNNHSLEDTNSKIILYLLKQKQNPIMSISKMADDCFVSTATISRFIRKFTGKGFDDFTRVYNKEITSSVPFMFRLEKKDEKNLRENSSKFLENYSGRIIDSINNMLSTIDYGEVDNLLFEINKANRVFLFGFDSTLDSLSHLQVALNRGNKLLFMAYRDELQFELAKQLKESDLAIIVTSFGTFFNKLADVSNEIINSKAKTVLITQNVSSLYSIGIDVTINLSSIVDPRAGSYSMDIFLDFIARRYYYLFNE